MNADRNDRFAPLLSPAFIGALTLLLFNDLVLKAAYPNWFTGKLSDFAGLFAFPYFLTCLWPRRKLLLHVLVAVAFVAWKLPLSREFVALWNSAPWFDIARVEDLTDLVALVSVPFSYRLHRHWASIAFRPAGYVLAVVALLAFTGTSKQYDAPLRGLFYFPGNSAEMQIALRAGGADVVGRGTQLGIGLGEPANDRAGYCISRVYLEGKLIEFSNGTLLTLERMSGPCEFDEANTARTIREFWRQVATPARLETGRPARFQNPPPPQATCRSVPAQAPGAANRLSTNPGG